MLEKVDTPRELFLYRLAVALKMEQRVLKMLPQLEQKVGSSELQELFHHHAEQTEEHVTRLEDAFVALAEDVDQKTSPAVLGLDMEGKSTLRKAGDDVMDAVALASAAETEHYEIAVYEDLLAHAEAMGEERAAALLRRNLDEELETLEAVKAATGRVARELAVART